MKGSVARLAIRAAGGRESLKRLRGACALGGTTGETMMCGGCVEDAHRVCKGCAKGVRRLVEVYEYEGCMLALHGLGVPGRCAVCFSPSRQSGWPAAWLPDCREALGASGSLVLVPRLCAHPCTHAPISRPASGLRSRRRPSGATCGPSAANQPPPRRALVLLPGRDSVDGALNAQAQGHTGALQPIVPSLPVTASPCDSANNVQRLEATTVSWR